VTTEPAGRARLRSPLARRLILGIVLFSVAVTLAVAATQLYLEYRRGLRDIEARFEQIEQGHLKALTQSLWATNHQELALQLAGITHPSVIEYAAVHDGQRWWAEAGRRVSRNTIERHYPMYYAHRGTPVQVGTLTVVASVDSVYRDLHSQTVTILTHTAIRIFLVAGFILVFFHQLVNRHFSTIIAYLRTLNPGSAPAALALARRARRVPDELDELTAAINNMHEKTLSALAALRDSEQRFHAIADYTPNWESWIGRDGRLVWVNSSVERLTGYTPQECLTLDGYPLPIVCEEDRGRVAAAHAGANHGQRGENLEYRVRHKDGTLRWMAESWQPIRGADGELLGHRSSVRDIAALKEVEHVLEQKISALAHAEETQRRHATQAQQEQARMVSLLSAMSIGILFEDTDKRVLYHNPAFRRMWLIDDEVDLKGKDTREVLRYSANVLARPDHFSRHILQVLATHEVSETFEIVMADGRVVTQLSYPVHDPDGRFIGRLWIYEDVTRERQTAEQLIYLAERDSLTGLYNRHRFQEELSRMLVEAERRRVHGALLFFDLDEFKYINDNFGHRAGDAMLIRVAGEVGALVRRNEILARIGGDEFAVLVPDASAEDTARLAERIIRAVSQIPFRFEGQNLRLTTSLGIAMYPEHGANAEDLVAHADAAMYQAKEAGKNAWRRYRADLDTSREMLGRLTWQERIANALDKGLFQLHFQGVYRAADGALSHLEALVRMVDETGSGEVIMPGHFIGIAEKTGQIASIDRWVVREVAGLLARTGTLPAIAVNISGRSFDDPLMPQFIADTLRAAGVAPHRLMVELTETAAVSDLHDAQRFIEALHADGSRVCLDDFGTGFASFAYLKYLRAEVLKIDGLFVRNLANDHDNQVFVKSIVDVARGLRKVTIAEFVEDVETLDMLRQFGVDMVQGYYLDMPRAAHPALRSDDGMP
jgi:diguanylate cyclase (GGDEF)-like protein/PAS domain S-box-containing protein